MSIHTLQESGHNIGTVSPVICPKVTVDMPRSSWDGQLPMAFRIWLTASAMAAMAQRPSMDYWHGP